MGSTELGTQARSLNVRCGVAAVLVCAVVGVTGCGNMIYAVNANAATNRLEEARELNAEQLAPYEYYYAAEHLQKAQSEAAEADYGDAADLALVSEEYAAKAVEAAKAARGVDR